MSCYARGAAGTPRPHPKPVRPVPTLIVGQHSITCPTSVHVQKIKFGITHVMPYRRTFKRRRRRRRPYKRRTRRRVRGSMRGRMSVRVPRPGPLGRSHKTLLRYSEIGLGLNPGVAGASAQWIFSCNGLYDPDITGVGHQPAGFDQLMAMYDHYTVIGAKITVQFQNIDATYAQMCFLHVQDGTSTNIDARVLVENGQCTYTMLGAKGEGRTCASLSLKCNPARFLSRSKPMSDPELKGSASSNPSEQCFFVVTVAPPNASDTSTVYLFPVIEYVVVFHEPKQLALS